MESLKIKNKIKTLRDKIDDYREVLFVFKTIGESIAFIFFFKYNIKPQNFKENTGFVSGNEGFRNELKFLRAIFKHGAIGILNDLTLSLKYADLSVVVINDVQPFPLLVEVKTSNLLNQRGKRQIASLEKLSDYIVKDIPTDLYNNGEVMKRVEIATEEISYSNLLPDMFTEAREKLQSFKEVEEGLFYYVLNAEMGDKEIGEIFNINLYEKPIIQFVRLHLNSQQGYTPLILSLGNPKNYWDFLLGKFEILIVADFQVIENMLAKMGYLVSIIDEERYAFLVEGNGIGLKISHHFFQRYAAEFLSLEWIFKNSIAMIESELKNS